MILKCDCSSGDSYVVKDFAIGAVTIPWTVEFSVYIPSDTISALNSASATDTANFCQVESQIESDGTFVESGQWWTDFTSDPPSGSAPTDTWITVDATYDGTNITWQYDGTTLFTYPATFSFNQQLAELQVGGILSNFVSGEIYYIDNVFVTHGVGNTLVFSDDFESGDFSAWDSTIGNVSIVGDIGGTILTANFTGSPLFGAVPLTVNFTDSSTPGSGGTITDWSWDFGDSGTSLLQNPSHVYTTPGTYTVSETITSPDGTDTLTRTNYIAAVAPATNVTQDTAIALAGNCAQMTISNLGATTTPDTSDPLNTVYDFGTYARQVWHKLTNTTAQQVYARFTITNTETNDINIIGAIYLDNPASYQVPIERVLNLDNNIYLADNLSHNQSFTLGVALEPGQTVWLELAGDDGEDDGLGWNGTIELEWQLLNADFYDSISGSFDDPTATHADYVANLEGPQDNCVFPGATSYCKVGTTHFALVANAGRATFDCSTDMWKLEAWVWEEGSPATRYSLGLDYLDVGSTGNQGNPGTAGPSHPILRTDGENVWAVFYVKTQSIIHCQSSCDPPFDTHTVSFWSPAVYVWNGSGFSNLGLAGGRCFKWTDAQNGYPAGLSVGQLSAAASSAEPGVLHVVWSEAGVTQVELCGAGVGCAIESYAQRVVYARYSSSGIEEYDLSIFEDAGHDPTTVSYYISGCEFITNAFGDLILFYSKPQTYNPALINSSSIVSYGSTIEMYSIDSSSAAPTLLQSYDFHDDFPLITHLWSDFGNRITGTQQFQQAYQGTNTIFISVGISPTDYRILSVPADSSAAITSSGIGGFIADTYCDTNNLWLSVQGPTGQLIEKSLECSTTLIDANYIGVHNGTSPCIPYATGIENKGMEFIYNSDNDSFYTLGWNCTDSWNSTTGYNIKFAPLKIPIERDYLVCSVGDCTISLVKLVKIYPNGDIKMFDGNIKRVKIDESGNVTSSDVNFVNIRIGTDGTVTRI